MRKLLCFFTIIGLALLSGCQKYGLNVTKVKIGSASLASTFVATPDPRQKYLVKGDQLFIEWNLEDPTPLKDGGMIQLDVIYRDFKEKSFLYPVKGFKGNLSFFHLKQINQPFEPILTYKASLLDSQGHKLDELTHKMWFSLIPLEQEAID